MYTPKQIENWMACLEGKINHIKSGEPHDTFRLKMYRTVKGQTPIEVAQKLFNIHKAVVFKELFSDEPQQTESHEKNLLRAILLVHPEVKT